MDLHEMIENDCDEHTPMWKLRLYSWLLHLRAKKMNKDAQKFINNYLKEHPEVAKLWKENEE